MLLIGWTFAFLYHFLNGVRHLFWDLGLGFERRSAMRAAGSPCSGAIALDALRVGLALARRAHELAQPLGPRARRGIGQGGHAHWWAQRVTAVALIPLTLWFFFSLLLLPDLDYLTVHAWLSVPLSAFLAVLLVAVLTYHSYLGTHGRGRGLRACEWQRSCSCCCCCGFSYVLCGGAGIFAILRVAFGS